MHCGRFPHSCDPCGLLVRLAAVAFAALGIAYTAPTMLARATLPAGAFAAVVSALLVLAVRYAISGLCRRVPRVAQRRSEAAVGRGAPIIRGAPVRRGAGGSAANLASIGCVACIGRLDHLQIVDARERSAIEQTDHRQR